MAYRGARDPMREFARFSSRAMSFKIVIAVLSEMANGERLITVDHPSPMLSIDALLPMRVFWLACSTHTAHCLVGRIDREAVRVRLFIELWTAPAILVTEWARGILTTIIIVLSTAVAFMRVRSTRISLPWIRFSFSMDLRCSQDSDRLGRFSHKRFVHWLTSQRSLPAFCLQRDALP